MRAGLGRIERKIFAGEAASQPSLPIFTLIGQHSHLFVSFLSVGRPIHEKVMITQNEQETFIGDAAVSTSLRLFFL